MEALIVSYLFIVAKANNEGILTRPKLSEKKWREEFTKIGDLYEILIIRTVDYLDILGEICMLDILNSRGHLFLYEEENKETEITYFGETQVSTTTYNLHVIY
jgi:hypothetical protein